MSFEPLARIPESTQPGMAPSVKLTIVVTEAEYHGLHALLNWVEGYQSATRFAVRGHHELVTHFRNLTAAIKETKKGGSSGSA